MLATHFRGVGTGVEQITLPATGATRLARYVCYLDALDRKLDDQPYDVVHAMLPVRRCDVYHPHAGVAADALATGHLQHRTRARRLLSKWGNRLNRKRRRFAGVERRLLLEQRPLVLCLSEYVKRAVRAHYPLAEDRLATLFNAVDLSRFDPAARPGAGSAIRRQWNIADDKVIALMIAQDFERKGLRHAIAAWKRLADPRLVLLVVGKDDAAPYRKLAADTPHPDQLIFAGATTDPYAYYQAGDFLVLPTHHDPCSLVALEALAMGLPVISTVFNGACEIMREGEQGYVLPDPADHAALAAAMARLLDPHHRAAAREAALALRPSLSYPRHLDRLIELYATLK